MPALVTMASQAAAVRDPAMRICDWQVKKLDCCEESPSELRSLGGSGNATQLRNRITQLRLEAEFLPELGQQRKSTVANRTLQIAALATASAANDDFSNPATPPPPTAPRQMSLKFLALSLAFGGFVSFLHTLTSTLPPDFWKRWNAMMNEQPEEAAPAVEEARGGTTLYDCHGTVIATVVPGGFTGRKAELEATGRVQAQGPVQSKDLPPYLLQAVIASEDRRFFDHQGFDPRGLARAALSFARSGGGSTITQQLVKNVFLSNERKWSRKLMELVLAVLLELRLSKWEILQLYLNKIYWGHGVYGIEAASALYFGKQPGALSLGECAMLVGIIPAPELLSPYRDPSRGRKPQARTLRRMVEGGVLDVAAADAAMREALVLGREVEDGRGGPWKAPYFVSEVLYHLHAMYGKDRVLNGGLHVYTTVDLDMQSVAEREVREAGAEYDQERMQMAQDGIDSALEKEAAVVAARDLKIAQLIAAHAQKRSVRLQAAVDRATSEEAAESLRAASAMVGCEEERSIAEAETQRFLSGVEFWEKERQKYEQELRAAADSRLEGSLVAMEPLSGEVRVVVGGREYYHSNFNRATQAWRPPGSTFKPVVYLTALAGGISKDAIIVDEPYQVDKFIPQNFDRKFRGPVTVGEALIRSLNVPTVKLCAEVGVENVVATGRALGITTPLPHELALALGHADLTPLQLTSVYSTIASGGFLSTPRLIRKVVDADGRVLHHPPLPSAEGGKVAAVNEAAVAQLRQLLQLVVERGTGRRAQIPGRPCAGKTGTSDGHRDVWFAGFTPQLAAVVWLGYDDNHPVGGLHPGTGSSHAAPLWQRFMEAVHRDLPLLNFHDQGTDSWGGRAPQLHFEKKSRRPHKVFLRDGKGSTAHHAWQPRWREVFDWEKASLAHEERDKMSAWVQARQQTLAPSTRGVEEEEQQEQEEEEGEGGEMMSGWEGETMPTPSPEAWAGVHPLELEAGEYCLARPQAKAQEQEEADYCETVRGREAERDVGVALPPLPQAAGRLAMKSRATQPSRGAPPPRVGQEGQEWRRGKGEAECDRLGGMELLRCKMEHQLGAK